jgi:signal recognition particle GTPase
MVKKKIYEKILDEMEEKLIRIDIDIRTTKKVKNQMALVPKSNPQQDLQFRQALEQLEMMKSNIITSKEIVFELIEEENKLSRIKLK